MLAAVLAIIDGLITSVGGGASVAAALSAITGAQWVNLGVAALGAAPTELIALGSLSGPLSGLINEVVSKVVAAGEATIASEAAKAWITANGDAAIAHDPGISTQS